MRNQNQVEQVREILSLKKNTEQADEPALESAPVTADVPEELLVDMPDEEVEVEASEQVEDDTAEAQAEDDAGEPEGAPESYSVSSLAEAIGWEPGELYEVEVPLDNGQTVKLGELKNEHQNTLREYEQTKAKLAEVEGSVGGLAGAGQQVSEEVMHAMSAREALIMQYQQVDWAQQEQADPGNAALLKQKYQSAYAQAEQAVQAAQQKEQHLRQEGLQVAYNKMLEMVPEWKDESVRSADHEQIRGLMREYGYDDGTIGAVSDPRALKLFRDYSRLRAEKQAAEGSIQKVRKAPRVLKGHKAAKPVVKADAKAMRRKIDQLPAGQQRGAELEAVKKLFASRR